MQRTRYTDEQRDEALRLLAECGKAEASKRSGIPAGTIASWGHRHDVSAPPVEEIRKANETMVATTAQRRTALGGKFLSAAEKLLRDAGTEDTPIDRKRLVEAARIAAETSNLLLGEATARVDAMGGSPREQAMALVSVLRQKAS